MKTYVELSDGDHLVLEKFDGFMVRGGNSEDHPEDFIELRCFRKVQASVLAPAGYETVCIVFERDEFEDIFHGIRMMMGREWWAPRSG